jgi:lysophospholipase L1-like esterase
VVSDSIAVTLLDSGYNQFHVYLDGQLLPGKLVAKSGKHCYMLAQGLAVGEHDIALTRLTEPVWGETTLVALHAGEFRKLPAPTRRLEVIGDSITTAYGIDGANQFCKFTPDTQDFDQSYPALVARHFGAEVSVVAWSGKGVFSNRGNTTDPMPVLWRRSVAHVPSSVWDFSRYQPDAVIINLATNDFAPENLDLAPFRRAYASFLQELRQAYPNALLVSALGPMLSDEWPKDRTALTTARAELKAAILERTAAGDRRIAFVEHPKVLPSEGFGCDFHPTKATHARMAKELVPVLATLLAWKP